MNPEENKINSDGSRIFLFYPPGAMYQRGEDRSQGNISDSTATSMRAPNDMGYLSAILKGQGCEVFFRDYQTENATLEQLRKDFLDFSPSVLVLSVTNATIRDDVRIALELKDLKPGVFVILKGALFFDPGPELFDAIDFSGIDCLVGGESEFSMAEIVECYRRGDLGALAKVRGVLFRGAGGQWIKTDFSSWAEDLDALPYPDRGVINNALYMRPDTKTPQATIITSRGCPAACVYCLTPRISGQKVRYRTPQNILGELKECYYKFGISDFFFRSDTFTINSEWVNELCAAIKSSELNGKIHWVANSRAKPLSGDTLKTMKEAGCWLVAFGFESGSEDSLVRMKKGASVSDNLRAARLAKEAGLEIYGFYMIGFPWETRLHLEETRRHIFELDADYIEVHVAVPYFGTSLYDIAARSGVIDKTVIGKDYFNPPTVGTEHLPIEEILEFRRRLLLDYHLRWGFVRKKIRKALRHPSVMANYMGFGFRLLRNNLRHRLH